MAVDITPLIPAGRQVLEGYGDGGFRISGSRHQGSVLILPDRTQAWAPTAFADITEDALSPVFALAADLEILVVGCGASFAPAPFALRRACSAAGLGLEWMDTGAAARTYSALLIEGRRAAAALIAV